MVFIPMYMRTVGQPNKCSGCNSMDTGTLESNLENKLSTAYEKIIQFLNKQKRTKLDTYKTGY